MNIPNVTLGFLQSHGLSESFPARFFAKIEIVGECWLWRGGKSKNGYGAIGRAGRGSGQLSAHVASWLLHFGAIPDGLFVCHNCPGMDLKACVKPSHLWLGTQTENTRDASAKGVLVRGVGHHNAKLTDDSVILIRKLRGSGESLVEIGKMFNVSWRQVWNICSGRAWRHVHG